MRRAPLPFLILAASAGAHFLAPAQALAAGACSAQDAPAPGVADWLANADKIMYQVRASAASSRCGSSGTGVVQGILSQPAQEGMRLGEETVQGFNQVSDFSSFLSTWQFYVGMPIARPDAPGYLYRDADLLELEHAKIQKLGKAMASKCALNAKIPQRKVNLSGKVVSAAGWPDDGVTTVSDALKQLNRASNTMLAYYRGVSVGWEMADQRTAMDDARGAGRILPDGAAQSVRTAYGVEQDVCASGDGSLKRLTEAAMRVVTFWGAYGQASKSWEEGWKLMSGLGGGGGSDYDKAERALLQKELARQGVNGRAADKMLANLDRRNKSGDSSFVGFVKSMGENVVDTFRDFGSQVAQEYDRFNEEAAKFRARGASGRGGGSMPSEGLFTAASDALAADALGKDLAANYLAADALSRNGSNQAQSAARILADAHRRLDSTYSTLVGALDDAAAVCNGQGANVAAAREACNARKLLQTGGK